MVENGKASGSSTTTGKIFEREADVVSSLERNSKLTKKKGKLKTQFILCEDGVDVGTFMISHDLYKFMDDMKISYKGVLSKKLLPDGFLVNYKTGSLYIIEKKFQKGPGSVDEKLQTCDFKRRQYLKLFGNTEFKRIEYVYLLNDWFKQECYSDTLQYINEVGCHYFFNEIPAEFLGF